MGEITTEEFGNIGGAGFPFQRTGVFLDKGCVSPFAVIKANQSFFMIGKGLNESPAIWQFTGSAFQRKSTDAIDTLLQKASKEELDEAFGIYYGSKGDYFVCFTFSNRTLVLDLVTEKWHERESILDQDTEAARALVWGYGDEASFRWRVNSLVTAYDRVLVGDSEDGRIGVLDYEEYAEYENSMLSYFVVQPFFSAEGVTMPKLEMTMESGVGNDYVTDPQVSQSISGNGKVFGPEKMRSVGKKGQFNHRIVWRRSGRYDRMAFLRYAISDRVKRVFIRLDAK